MTVSSTNTIVRASANGTDTEFSFDFLLLEENDLQVKVSEVLADPSSYTVTIDTEDDGGSVTFDSPPTAGSLVEISRVLAIVQQTEYPVAGPFPAQAHERALDRLTMICQQMNTAVLSGTSAFAWLGVWATGTSYPVRALVEGPDGNWYYCAEAHEAGTFSADLAAGLWVLLINRASLLESVADAEAAEQGAIEAQVAAEYAQNVAQEAALNIVAAWEDDPTSYDFPDLVAGTDGHTYRCLGTAVVGVDPTTDDGTNWFRLTGMGGVPVGSIIPFVGGYFTDGSNGGFTSVLGNTASALNTLLNDTGFYVCDGAELNISGNTIFDGAGRYLPNLTDDRFVMGDTAAGVTGGSSSIAHTHDVDIASFTSGATTLTTAQIPSHSHSVSVSSGGAHTHSLDGGVTMSGSTLGSGGSRGDKTGTAQSAGDHSHSASGGSAGGGGSHNHAVNPPSTTSGPASVTENRPKFLSVIYVMKVA